MANQITREVVTSTGVTVKAIFDLTLNEYFVTKSSSMGVIDLTPEEAKVFYDLYQQVNNLNTKK